MDSGKILLDRDCSSWGHIGLRLSFYMNGTWDEEVALGCS